MGFDLSTYATVEERLKLFWDAYPDGRITTEIVKMDDHAVLFRSAVYRQADDLQPVAVGHAYEEKSDRGVNSTSHVENCETSAIGRALANYVFAAGKRASREEMEKVAQMGGQPLPSTPAVLATPGGIVLATPPQVRLLRALKFKGDPTVMSKSMASQEIERLKALAVNEDGDHFG